MAVSALKSIENQNGELVFAGTDTAISIFFNYLKAGRNTETFLEDYSKVHLQQVLDLLEQAEQQFNH
jgi:uncharacterized protein (DUF433 family)